jgi:hypothetical protein
MVEIKDLTNIGTCLHEPAFDFKGILRFCKLIYVAKLFSY